MSLIINEIFNKLGSRIYYVTGQNKSYVKIFPNRGERVFSLKHHLSLKDYLTAYGFEYKDTSPYKDFESAKRIFDFYVSTETETLKDLFEPIRIRRGRNMTVESTETKKFLDKIKYASVENLSKKDTKYLSGDWFEEYVYFKIKDELQLSEEEIATGLNLNKEGTPNEIDVVFIHDHKLYIIECKTSVIDLRNVRLIRAGQEAEEERKVKILPEVIYKSDALRSKFGLFANTSIFTLEEIKTSDGKPKSGYEIHFERAELSKINIISKGDICSDKTMKELLKIK
jgi:hypothetical protein